MLSTSNGKGPHISPSGLERKKGQFKQSLRDAISEEPGLSDDDVEQYTEYVVDFGKLDKYLGDNKFGKSQFKRKYLAFKNNKDRINKLNENPNKRRETSHGRVFEESYGINKFTDMDIEERKAFLRGPKEDEIVRRRLPVRTPGCTSLPSNYFDANNAANHKFDYVGHCGAVKNQGDLETCWAFSATGQFQCNNNYQRNENKVFSEKYLTDCSPLGSVTKGGKERKLTGWYTRNGACDNYYKAYNPNDERNINNDCNCLNSKLYGQCYEIDPQFNHLNYANAVATGYSWTFGIDVTDDFFDITGNYFGCAGETFGHAMTMVGQWYGDWLLFRNSWGSDWAESGYGWLHKDVWASCGQGWNPTMTMTFLPATPTPTVPLTPVRGNVVANMDNDYFFNNNDKLLNNYPRPIDSAPEDYNNDNFLTYIAFGVLIGVCFTLCILNVFVYRQQKAQHTKVKYAPVSFVSSRS